MGDCGQCAWLWPRAEDPAGAMLSAGGSSAPRRAHRAVSMCWVQPSPGLSTSQLDWGCRVGAHVEPPGAGAHGGRRGVVGAGGTASLLDVGSSQATSGHQCRIGHKGTSCDLVCGTSVSAPKSPQLLYCSCSCANPSASHRAWPSRRARPSCTSWHGHVPAQLPTSSGHGMPVPNACSTRIPLHTRAAPGLCRGVRATSGTILHPHPLASACPQAFPCAQGRGGVSRSARPEGAKPLHDSTRGKVAA